MLRARRLLSPGLARAAQCRLRRDRWGHHRWLSLSAREAAKLEDEVLAELRGVVPSGGRSDVVSTGLVKQLAVSEGGVVSFRLASGDDALRRACIGALQARLPWLTSASVALQPPGAAAVADMDGAPGLEGVKHIVAVSSCKGGVGKSTVAVNLAYALAREHKVGILDADVYGPSLPTMLVAEDDDWAVRQSSDGRLIEPVALHGLKCMSYGFVAPGTGGRGGGRRAAEDFEAGRAPPGPGAAVLRGPMVSKVLTQMLTKTDWGELDFLVVDMPPGTGDINITLGQQASLSGAVVVTTPQRLSFVDVLKGIDMFAKLEVPTVAVVENMAYFDGDDGKRYRPFGEGHAERLLASLGLPSASSFQLPILRETAESGDRGTPFIAQHADSPTAATYAALAASVACQLHVATPDANATADSTADSTAEVAKGTDGAEAVEGAYPRATSSVTFNEARGVFVARFLGDKSAVQLQIAPLELRRRLRKVDDMLGNAAEDLDEDLRPLRVEPVGNYAVSVVWSDGHDATIYPFADIKQEFS